MKYGGNYLVNEFLLNTFSHQLLHSTMIYHSHFATSCQSRTGHMFPKSYTSPLKSKGAWILPSDTLPPRAKYTTNIAMKYEKHVNRYVHKTRASDIPAFDVR